MHLHYNQCFCCTWSFRFFSGMFHQHQKLWIVCLVTIAIVSDQTAFGQNLLSSSRQQQQQQQQQQEYGSDINGEAVAANSLSSLSPNEPTCEELRMMWRFSKRQSRSSEITNELPTYRDPFAYNVWKPYSPSTRSYEQTQRKYREPLPPVSSHVYGRVVHKQPLTSLMEFPDRARTMDRFYVPDYKTVGTPRRSSNRMGGSGVYIPSRGNQIIAPQRGSFHRLKELVWTERAKELQAQRRAEEIAARMAILKNIANGERNAEDLY